MLLSRSWIYINTLFTSTFIRKRLSKWRNLLLISTAYTLQYLLKFLAFTIQNRKWRNLLLISTAYTLQYLLKFLAFTIQNKRIIYCCVNNRIKIKLIAKVCSTSLW